MFKKALFMLILSCLLLSSATAAPAADGLKTTLTFYGQSAFLLTHGDTKVLFDPWLSTSPWKAVSPDAIDCQYILVSHGHGDHVGDTAAIAKRTGAKVIATAELARMLKEQGCEIMPMSIGGKKLLPFGYVKVVPAVHGSGVPGGVASGFVVDFYGTKLYFAGDTDIFGDMAFIAREKLDYALLPIGDNYTMGLEDATESVKILKPKTVIPMHYNSNPLIQQSPEAFKAMVEKNTKAKTIIMSPGESIEL